MGFKFFHILFGVFFHLDKTMAYTVLTLHWHVLYSIVFDIFIFISVAFYFVSYLSFYIIYICLSYDLFRGDM